MRASYNSGGEITPETFDQLIGKYHLGQMVKCRHSKEGTLCRHDHRCGWLARLKDGTEVLLGHECAEKYFNAPNFKSQEAALTRTIEITDEQNKLNRILERKVEHLEHVAELLDQVDDLRRKHQYLLDTLPRSLQHTLDDISRSGDTTILIEVRSPSEKGNQSWREERVARILGIGFWRKQFGKTKQNLESVQKTLREARTDQGHTARKLRAWSKSIDSISISAKSVAESNAELSKFVTLENLTRMLLLIRSQQDQEQFVTSIPYFHDSLQFKGQQEKHEFIKRFEKEVKASLKIQEFRRFR